MYVVICFHFTIFVVLETTQCMMDVHQWRCDLLSFYYLCRTGNNKDKEYFISLLVVICFHFTIFVVLETTFGHGCSGRYLLWFAFILLSLSYWKQQVVTMWLCCLCCDLLSFYYLCRTGNNPAPIQGQDRQVVICFHFTIFVVLETTGTMVCFISRVLWFAFILLSLSYWKQRSPRTAA